MWEDIINQHCLVSALSTQYSRNWDRKIEIETINWMPSSTEIRRQRRQLVVRPNCNSQNLYSVWISFLCRLGSIEQNGSTSALERNGETWVAPSCILTVVIAQIMDSPSMLLSHQLHSLVLTT